MNRLYTVCFPEENTSVKVSENSTVMEALKKAGIFLDAPCGGQGTCGKCLVSITDSSGTHTKKACRTQITENLLVSTKGSALTHRILLSAVSRSVPLRPVLPVQPDTQNCCMAAFDIGTTTIAAYLLDSRTGQELCTASALNPQASYGADVISRANYALEHGEEALTRCIRLALSSLLETLVQKAGIQSQEVYQICLVGNTCMHHLYFGLPLNSLVLAPYMPVQKNLRVEKAADFGFSAHKEAELIFLPVIAGFVGADTIGCLLSVRPDRKEEISLILDIGTNGELVLGNRNRLVCCSTAAGPAFEGAKIECGMRGAQGAIDHVFLADGAIKYTVLSGTVPKGICGSGLIDLIAVLRRLGLIDETGRLLTSAEAEELFLETSKDPSHSSETDLRFPGAEQLKSHLTDIHDMPAFLPDPAYPSVYLTQKDIREVQLAKGAISAGILLLEKALGINHDQVGQVYIAGAFGNYMDPASACAMGLLPGALSDRIRPIGNAAGEGAKIALLNAEERQITEKLMDQVEFLELATMPEFQDFFIDELEFPPCVD